MPVAADRVVQQAIAPHHHRRGIRLLGCILSHFQRPGSGVLVTAEQQKRLLAE